MKASTGTMYVMPYGEGQGEKVLIEKSNFNPKFHKKYLTEAEMKAAKAKAEAKKKADAKKKAGAKAKASK